LGFAALGGTNGNPMTELDNCKYLGKNIEERSIEVRHFCGEITLNLGGSLIGVSELGAVFADKVLPP